MEWTFDYNHGGLAMTDYVQTLAGTTATTTSTAFTSLLQVANPASTSTVVTAVAPDEGHQFFNTITVQYYLRKKGKFIPYLEAGGGLLNNFGGMPAVNFTNTLTIPGSPGITEVDHMVVRYDPSPVAGVLTVGAGFKYYAGSNWGIRMDLRDNMAWESTQTQVWTMPAITTTGVNSVTAFNAGTGSSMVFANNGTSTLQPASAIRGLRTFQNDRVKHYLVPTIGIFWRF
ncbi:MAG TPA: hypothetical protein VL382_07340 [Terriglobales bacterium]|nr:hypothetical protein [Terriglobales bacterium]